MSTLERDQPIHGPLPSRGKEQSATVLTTEGLLEAQRAAQSATECAARSVSQSATECAARSATECAARSATECAAQSASESLVVSDNAAKDALTGIPPVIAVAEERPKDDGNSKQEAWNFVAKEAIAALLEASKGSTGLNDAGNVVIDLMTKITADETTTSITPKARERLFEAKKADNKQKHNEDNHIHSASMRRLNTELSGIFADLDSFLDKSVDDVDPKIVDQIKEFVLTAQASLNHANLKVLADKIYEYEIKATGSAEGRKKSKVPPRRAKKSTKRDSNANGAGNSEALNAVVADVSSTSPMANSRMGGNSRKNSHFVAVMPGAARSQPKYQPQMRGRTPPVHPYYARIFRGNPVYYPDGSVGYAFEPNSLLNYGSSPMSRGPSIGLYQNEDDHISRLLRQRARPTEECRQAALREKQQASVRNALRTATTTRDFQHAIEKAKRLNMDYEIASAAGRLEKILKGEATAAHSAKP